MDEPVPAGAFARGAGAGLGGSRDEPLGKPQGTVRAYLALAIVAAFLCGHLGAAIVLLHGGETESGLALLGALALEAGTVTGFYFGTRQTAA